MVIFSYEGREHLFMYHLNQFEKLIDFGVGLVFMHYAVEITVGRSVVLMS